MKAKQNPAIVQSVAFAKKHWRRPTAEKWLREHGFLAPVADETAHWWRYRQIPPEGLDRLRTKTVRSEGREIHLLIGWPTAEFAKRNPGLAHLCVPTKDPKKAPCGGLTAKGRKAMGGNLKPGVTAQGALTPEQARRKGSFLRRFYARATIPPLMDKQGRPTRFALAAQAWGEAAPRTMDDVRRLAALGAALLAQAKGAKGNPLTRRPDPMADRMDAMIIAGEPKALARGIAHEMEHTTDPAEARQIALDHLREHPDYYQRLAKCGLAERNPVEFGQPGEEGYHKRPTGDELNAHLASGGHVQVSTYTMSTVYGPKHAGFFKEQKGDLYVRRGKHWDCLTGAGGRLLVSLRVWGGRMPPAQANPAITMWHREGDALVRYHTEDCVVYRLVVIERRNALPPSFDWAVEAQKGNRFIQALRGSQADETAAVDACEAGLGEVLRGEDVVPSSAPAPTATVIPFPGAQQVAPAVALPPHTTAPILAWQRYRTQKAVNAATKAMLKHMVPGVKWSVTSRPNSLWTHIAFEGGQGFKPQADEAARRLGISPLSGNRTHVEADRIMVPADLLEVADRAVAGVEKAKRAATPLSSQAVSAGTVVHFLDNRRRYVVSAVHNVAGFITLNLVALSGGDRGSHPTGINPAQVELDPDQTVAFSGPRAGKLSALYKRDRAFYGASANPSGVPFSGQTYRPTLPSGKRGKRIPTSQIPQIGTAQAMYGALGDWRQDVAGGRVPGDLCATTPCAVGECPPCPPTDCPEPQGQRDGGLGLAGLPTAVLVADAQGNVQQLPARYRLVEASQVIPSHTQNFGPHPAYPAGLQERGYEYDKAEQAKVVVNAQRFVPSLAVNTNPDGVNGPPVVVPSGIVLGGNSRTMTMQRVYAVEPARAGDLRAYLVANANTFGFSQADVAAFAEPILVREVADPGDWERLRDLVRRLNESWTQAMDPLTDQIARGRRVTDDVIHALSISLDPLRHRTFNDYLRSAQSKALIDALERVGIIDRRNRAAYLDSGSGLLREDGRTMVTRVLLGSVIADPHALEGLGQKTRENLAASIPWIAAARAANPAFDIAAALMPAARAFGEMKDHGEPDPRLFLKQGELHYAEFGGGPSGAQWHTILGDPMASAVLAILVGRNGSNVMAAGFKRYAQIAQANQAGGLPGLGGTPAHEALRVAFDLGPDPLATVSEEVREKKKKGKGDEALVNPGWPWWLVTCAAGACTNPSMTRLQWNGLQTVVNRLFSRGVRVTRAGLRPDGLLRIDASDGVVRYLDRDGTLPERVPASKAKGSQVWVPPPIPVYTAQQLASMRAAGYGVPQQYQGALWNGGYR